MGVASLTLGPAGRHHHRVMTSEPSAQRGTQGAVRVGQLLVDLGLVTALEVARAVATQRSGDPRRLGEILVAQGACAPDTLERVLVDYGVATPVPPPGAVVDQESLRELESLRDALMWRAAGGDDTQLLLLAERLDRVVTDLVATVDGEGGVRSQPADPDRSSA
jgi:hypothetical protein